MRHAAVLTAASLAMLAAVHLCLLDGLDGVLWSYGFAEDTVFAPGYSDSGFRRVRRGMTRQDVIELMGEPLEQHGFGDIQVWRYARSANDRSYRARVIRFLDGRVLTKESRFMVD